MGRKMKRRKKRGRGKEGKREEEEKKRRGMRLKTIIKETGKVQ